MSIRKVLVGCEFSGQVRSKTYFGIAQAMAAQWGDYICEH